MPYPPAGALPLALVASPFISPAPNFSGPAISPIDANEPVGSQGATLSYTAATEAEHVKLTARNNRTLLKPTKRVPCRTFTGAQWCGVEWDEWTMATAVLHPSDAIVEFGGRWGTTSCMLASITQNSGRVVAVEPDAAAHGPLLRNRASHNANFHVLKGTVSEQPLTLSALEGRTVVFAYPRTGEPGKIGLVDDWDMIPGARGCTPQTCAFRDLFADLKAAGAAQVFGLSTQSNDYQIEMASRLHLPFAVLSDEALELTHTLKLPTMSVAGQTLIKRLALIIDDARITHVFYPVFPPDRNAGDVLEWLKDNPRND